MKTLPTVFRFSFSSLVVATCLGLASASEPSAPQIERASKIAANLGLENEVKQARVGAIVAKFYADLDELQSAGKTEESASKNSDERLTKLKQDFFEKLGGELTPEQIEKGVRVLAESLARLAAA